MKILLDQRQLGKNADGAKEFLENHLACETEINDGKISVTDNGDFSQTDIFEMGMQHGQEKEKAIWTKPATMHLPNDYAVLLKQAISEYSKRSYITVDSIKIGTPGKSLTEITIHPTEETHFFNIASAYGKLCFKKDGEVN
jgi:hypothetical protein